MLSDRTEKSEGFTKVEAGRAENLRFNRYRDVNPYDHSRVVLNGEHVTTDYINASLVKVHYYCTHTHKQSGASTYTQYGL